ncbi:protein IQ-DOMAIN 29-like isoform X2 [Prosopis cineraria]|uniref:protein IQ-DOMAIN 29-like isoform X2 n=1 Tax=Prosopis cineraria TaxID=364024 RepID=UPI0024100A5F|nr:protein IQ-DOMAIN 29-like isoform X2 [Prosopis cineraria]
MGRDPGKWIKTLFSGKKSPKSNRSSKKNILKPSSNLDVLACIEAPVPYIPDSSLISPPTSGSDASKEVLLEKVVVCRSSNDGNILSAGVEENNAEAVDSGSLDDADKIRLAEAAIKIQAGFRSYQAWRAFQTLKGVIQLQALIRGHLVRRQAVSTLYCVKGIVKVQALVRGHKVRHSDIGIAVLKNFKDTKCSNSTGVVTTAPAEKLSTSVFVNKLLASSSSPVSFHLNFDPGQPSFTWKWLERWTRSNFWAPLPKSEKKLDLKSNEKSSNCQTFENNKGKAKRNIKKDSGLKVDDGLTSESNKLKQPAKKVSSHPVQSCQEHPQKEIKNHIKKSSTQSVSSRSEVAPEKKKHITGKLSGHAVTDVSEQGARVSADKKKNLGVSKSKQSDLEKSLGLQAKDEHGESHNHSIAESQTSLKNGREVGREDSEDLKITMNFPNSLRRASLPGNFNDQYNDSSHSTPRLPSYMAPTESAKAKLRAQGSPRLAGDLVDKNGITRRYSFTSSLNGKFGLFSPRPERLLNTGSRGMIRTDISLSSLRDGAD